MVFGRGTSRSEDDRKHGGVSRRVFLALGAASVGGLLLTGRQALAAEADAYVSAFKVRSQTDGVGPFDADDEPGNDSSATNFIVRSFDSVNYLLEYTTELSDKTKPVEGATRLIATFTLPMDPSKARFDAQTLNWAQEATTTYWYEDGTSSTTWNKSKTVTKQVYRAVRLLEGKGADDRVPGAGQLSVGIKVYAAVQGEKVLPTFELVVDGDGRTKSCQPQAVTVSSYPRFDVRLTRYTSSMNRQAYFNLDDGSVNREDADGLINGRHEGYALSVRLQNTSADKGLKGLELPIGPITFDLHMSSAVAKPGEAEVDMSDDPDWGPIFWDYKENVAAGLNAKGKLGRNIAPFESTQSYACWTEFYNKSGGTYGAYNGGTWTIEQDAFDDDVYHVTVDDYQFDTSAYSFPVTFPGNPTTSINATANVGCFTAGYVQFVAPYPREVDTTLNYYLRAQIENMHIKTATVPDVTKQELTSNDYSSFTVPLYAPGTIDKYCEWTSVPGGRAQSVWNAGDSYGPPGSHSRAVSYLTYTGDKPVLAWNALLKFDDELLYLPDPSLFNATIAVSTVGSVAGNMRLLYAAKPDGSGWTDIAEMNQTPEEGLIYFDSLSQLEASGRTCVGLLSEVRDCRIYGGRDAAAAVSNVTLFVRPDAESGKVAGIVNDVRAWMSEESPMSWGDLDPAADGHYGDGSAGTTHKAYIDGYLKPYADIYRNYALSVYENGALTGGHSGGVRYGDSLLIVGAKNGINITVADRSGDEAKTTYDLDANERTARFHVQPTLALAAGSTEIQTGDLVTDLHVTVTLPVGLTYDDQSATVNPESVTSNADGTQTLVWVLPNVKVGVGVTPFEFDCTIGAAGTDHDVDNNEQLTVKATVTSALDQRNVTKSNGNLAETTIVCVKLAAISVFKQVSPAHANPDDPHTWTLRFGNSSETDVTDVTLLDVMPYDGDDRGSKFSGTYTVRRLIVDLSSAQSLYGDVMADPGSFFWVSGDETARDMNADELLVDPSMVACSFLHPTNVAGSVLTWDLGLDLSEIVAWGMAMDTMHGHEYMTMTLEIEPTGSKSKDVYVNSFSENATGQAAIVHSNVVRTDVEDVSFSVRKVWDGTNGFIGTPSVSVTVTGSDGSTQKLTLSEANSFSSWVKNLDRYADDGSRITYSVSEDAVPDGYELEGVEGSDTEGFVITNRALSAPGSLRKEASHRDWL